MPVTRYSGLRKIFKNLKKIDFSILVYLDVSENLESFKLYLFFTKNIVYHYYNFTHLTEHILIKTKKTSLGAGIEW